MSRTEGQLIHRAITFAAAAHKGQLRKGTKLDYLSHPMEVLQILTQMDAPAPLLAAGALHDVLEDTAVMERELRETFGNEITDLVFCDTENENNNSSEMQQAETPVVAAPKCSVVEVGFPGRDGSLSYYNDRFDLHCGDWVFVEGEMEGLRGTVDKVSYGFKIRASDYKRVIAAPETHMKGQFFLAGSHVISVDPAVLSAEKIRGWFLPPAEADEFLQGYSDEVINIRHLNDMDIEESEGKKGYDIYWDNQVYFICLNGEKGYAIVEDQKQYYEVEFEYKDGEARNLMCSCFKSGNCRHGVAALFQLRETLGYIEGYYTKQYEASGYFAAIFKDVFIPETVNRRNTGEISMSL